MLKKYYDDDNDAEYIQQKIYSISQLMKIITNQKKTKTAFNGNYIEYEINADKNTNLSVK